MATQQRRSQQAVKQTNQPSRLLGNDENNRLFQLIGARCVTLASAVVQVYLADPPNRGHWNKRCCGVATLIKDNIRRSYFIRIFDLKYGQCIWEQELYNNFQYRAPRPYFHTFDTDDCPAGINFANDDEADAFKAAVLEKVASRQQRRTGRRTDGSQAPANQNRAPPPMAATIPSRPAGGSAPAAMPVMLNTSQPNNNLLSMSGGGGTLKKDKSSKKDKKGKLTKADIGTPSDFRHVGHVGWDPDTGFDVDNLDPALKTLFDAAGVSTTDLKDKEQAAFIYDFIESHGGVEAIKQQHMAPPPPAANRPLPPPPAAMMGGGGGYHQQQPPPPPAMMQPPPPQRGPPPPRYDPPAHHQPPPPSSYPASSQDFSRSGPAPPPPPPQRDQAPRAPPAPTRGPAIAPPPPPPQAPRSGPPGGGGSRVGPPGAPPPPPPGPAPPPPPPPMSMGGGGGGPPPPPPPPGPPPPPSAGGGGAGRGGLLSEIQQGHQLRHRDQEEREEPAADGRNALLDSIKAGVSLTKVDRSQIDNRPKSESGEGLAGALARALASRAKTLQVDDDDDEDDDIDDDDWED